MFNVTITILMLLQMVRIILKNTLKLYISVEKDFKTFLIVSDVGFKTVT